MANAAYSPIPQRLIRYPVICIELTSELGTIRNIAKESEMSYRRPNFVTPSSSHGGKGP
jgi:hypothetical protein